MVVAGFKAESMLGVYEDGGLTLSPRSIETCRHRDARRCAVDSSGGNPGGEKGRTIRIARETEKDRDGRGGRDGPEEQEEEEEEKERWNGLGWVGG